MAPSASRGRFGKPVDWRAEIAQKGPPTSPRGYTGLPEWGRFMTDLEAICPKCGYRMGQHIQSECPVWEDWYCWECSGIGYLPGEWDWDPIDRDCPCCSDFDHSTDAELPPPCHPEARKIAVEAGNYRPGWTKWDWERAKAQP